MATAKRTLLAAEKAMNLQPGNIESAETRAFWLRCGISDSAELLPADCRRMNEILDGNYPPTMTVDDIAEIHNINQMLENACK